MFCRIFFWKSNLFLFAVFPSPSDIDRWDLILCEDRHQRTDRQTDRQTGRQTDRQTDRHTDTKRRTLKKHERENNWGILKIEKLLF